MSVERAVDAIDLARIEHLLDRPIIRMHELDAIAETG